MLAIQAPVARAAVEPTETVRILVHFRQGASADERQGAAFAVGAVVTGEIATLGITRMSAPIPRGADPAAVLDAIARMPGVALAEADERVRLASAPTDPYWSTDPLVGLGQWGARKIALDRALDLVGTLQPVVVAVVDTGVAAAHPDLLGAVLEGRTFVSAPSSACAPDGIGSDDNSHGTHVAGIIAARASNGIGIAGVASNARILPVKALDCSGLGSMSDIAEGITYAVDRGARIVNISLGTSSDSATLAAAVRYALSRNVLVVAAAGNCGNGPSRCFNTVNLPEYPGAYPGVVAVGATSTDDTIASFSTQGTQVALAAPGVRIVSTTPTYPTYQSERGAPTGYAAFSGTSQATPFVSGVAAVLLGADPSLTAQQLADRLKQNADDLGLPGTDVAFGAGRLNALRALSASLPAFAATYDATGAPRSATSGATFGARVTLTNTSQTAWSAAATDPVKLSYHWFDANGNVSVWDGVRTPLPADVPPGGKVTLVANVLAPPVRGAYTLRFDLVRDGLAWFSQRGVKTADVPVAVGSGLGATYTTAAASATLVTGAPLPLAVTLVNTGTRPWVASGPQQMRLASHWIRPDGTVALWDGARAPAFAADVAPGQSVTVALPLTPPSALGAYTLRLDLVQEGVTWFSGEGVTPRDIAYVVTSGYSASYAVPGGTLALLPGGRVTARVGVKNDGVLLWSAAGTNPVRIAAHLVDASGAVVIWDGARTSLVADVAPGVTGAYPVIIDAPRTAGTYRARVDLVREGLVWLSGLGVPPGEQAIAVIADYRAQLDAGPLSVSRSKPSVQVSLTNVSGVPWTTAGSAPVRLAAHWYDAAGNVLVWDGPRTELPRDVLAGETVSVTVALGSPPAGAAAVTIDLVSEGIRWFGAGPKRAVTLLP